MQNVYSKKLFREHIDHVMLLFYTSILSFALLFPVWIVTEARGILGTQDYSILLKLYFYNGFFHFMQNLLAFIALSKMDTLTYSVANTFKRVFVIATSLIYFQNKVTTLNIIGMLLARSSPLQ